MNQYGQNAPEDDKMNEIVANILAKEDERKKYMTNCTILKLLKYIKKTSN